MGYSLLSFSVFLYVLVSSCYLSVSCFEYGLVHFISQSPTLNIVNLCYLSVSFIAYRLFHVIFQRPPLNMRYFMLSFRILL